MHVLVVGPPDFNLAGVADALRNEEFMASNLAAPNQAKDTQGSPADLAALVVPIGGFAEIGEQTALWRSAIEPGIPLVVCCRQVNRDSARRLEQCGASKLIHPPDATVEAVAARLLGELLPTRGAESTSFGQMCGGTRVMRQLYTFIETVAPHSDAVLIQGETGTGKELVARELHGRSGRRGPFVPIDCAALAPELLQSELFGHERGAFTGAVNSRTGLLVEAKDGTVFLDEIGDLALPSQAKLLRALEERMVRPVGSNEWHLIRARLLFATNRNLEEACELGTFREDLYARLSGLTIRLPALRERLADIPLLVRRFVDAFNAEAEGREVTMATPLDCLFQYDWPRNVRELLQAVRRAAIFAQGSRGPLNLDELLKSCRHTVRVEDTLAVSFSAGHDTWPEVLARTQDAFMRSALAKAGGNKEKAAALAGLSRSQFYEKLKQAESRQQRSSPDDGAQ